MGKELSSEDAMDIMVSKVNSTILYIWNLSREYILNILTTYTNYIQYLCEVTEVLTNLMVSR